MYRFYRYILMVWKRWFFGLKAVHPTFFMAGRSWISRDIVVGAEVFFGRGCSICPKVTIKKYTLLGPGVVITGSDHRFDLSGTPIIFSGRPELLPTIIEEDVWIGRRSIIMAGVTIGRGSIVGAGAVVTKNVEPYEIVAGVPARKIGERFASVEDRRRHDEMLASGVMLGSYCGPLGK